MTVCTPQHGQLPLGAQLHSPCLLLGPFRSLWMDVPRLMWLDEVTDRSRGADRVQLVPAFLCIDYSSWPQAWWTHGDPGSPLGKEMTAFQKLFLPEPSLWPHFGSWIYQASWTPHRSWLVPLCACLGRARQWLFSNPLYITPLSGPDFSSSSHILEDLIPNIINSIVQRFHWVLISGYLGLTMIILTKETKENANQIIFKKICFP